MTSFRHFIKLGFRGSGLGIREEKDFASVSVGISVFSENSFSAEQKVFMSSYVVISAFYKTRFAGFGAGDSGRKKIL